jgi:hypothetical protein
MDLRVHYHVQSNLPLIAVLREINPIHTLLSCFFKIHLSRKNLCLPRLSKWSLFLRFTDQNHVYIYLLSTVYHMPCQSHLLDLIIQIMYVEDHRSLNLSLCNFLLCPFTSNFLVPNIFLSTLFWNTHIPKHPVCITPSLSVFLLM